ncbi:hypothetical protein BGX20_009267 [Mortierella sp. AD010]|nr:hypothetical protein BGX20_009267 [Mortierella sp. AD010]
MTAQKIKLFCVLDGDSSPFPVDIPLDVTIGDLKEAIKKKKEPEFDDITANRLLLYHVSTPSAPKRLISLNNLTADERKKKVEELEDQPQRSPKSLALLQQRKPSTSLFSVRQQQQVLAST